MIVILCYSDPLAMSNKASTAQLFDNMTLDIEQLLSKVCSLKIALIYGNS